jgi:hypothetical protein
VNLARKAGWDYLIVDGVNIPTERVAARYTKKQHWYSGKHKRHGAAVQTVAAPDGELLWVSGVLPGRTVDITAARRFNIAEKVLAFWDCWPISATSACTRTWSPDTNANVVRKPRPRRRKPPTVSRPPYAASANAPTPN